MATWVVRHGQTGAQISTHGTKKAANEQAAEAQAAHEKIDARHDGAAVTFQVEKLEGEET